jgi:SAM-dependent MidA family methyltransferase
MDLDLQVFKKNIYIVIFIIIIKMSNMVLFTNEMVDNMIIRCYKINIEIINFNEFSSSNIKSDTNQILNILKQSLKTKYQCLNELRLEKEFNKKNILK